MRDGLARSSRRAVLAAVGATALAAEGAGCLRSEYERRSLSTLLDDGLEEAVGENIAVEGYVEQSDEPAYFYHRRNGHRELVDPFNGVFRLYAHREPKKSEESLPVLHDQGEYDLPRSRDQGKRLVKGTIMTYYRDEDVEDEAHGLYFYKLHVL